MNTLSEQHYMRAQRQKKQQLYKNMLDQQIRLKQVRRQREVQHLRHPFSDARYPYQERNGSPYSPEDNKYLPPLNYQQARREPELDKTQIYLSNCEQIIRNLRQLKGKKQKWQAPAYSNNPSIRQQTQKEKPPSQYQYYPKINYFSSSASPYNKSTSLEPLKSNKLKSTRMKTIEDKPKESNANILKHKKQSQNQIRSNYEKEDGQSDSPVGIRQQSREKLSKKVSKVRHKAFKTVNLKNQDNSNQQMEESKIKSQQQTIQNLKKHQLELTACVVELTKCLKKLNQHKSQQQKQPQSNQKIEIKIEQSPPSKQTKKEQIGQNKIKESPSSKDQFEGQDQQFHEPQPDYDVDSLKYKVILALKKVNNKSQDFVLKMGDHYRSTYGQRMHHIKDTHRNTTSLMPTQSNSNQKQGSDERYKEQKKKWQNKEQEQQNNQKQHAYRQNGSKNEETQELLKLLSAHLSKHEDQNEELNKSLKELHEFLRNQNQQIKQLKSFRQSQVANEPKQNSPVKQPPQNSQSPRQQVYPAKKYLSQEQKRRKQLKLQEAVLKDLKKARMRGNLFKQKIENYRKEHNIKNSQIKGVSVNQNKQVQQQNPLQQSPSRQQKKVEQPKNEEKEKAQNQVSKV